MPSPSDRRTKIWSVVRVCSGNFLEMYDFMVFGYYASAIGTAFFPAGNAFWSLMLSFMTFGAGFLMRPLGAIVLGDRKSTRLNSSHTVISYAVFCLKKKTNIQHQSRGSAAMQHDLYRY